LAFPYGKTFTVKTPALKLYSNKNRGFFFLHYTTIVVFAFAIKAANFTLQSHQKIRPVFSRGKQTKNTGANIEAASAGVFNEVRQQLRTAS
jgi:hypothetical protein